MLLWLYRPQILFNWLLYQRCLCHLHKKEREWVLILSLEGRQDLRQASLIVLCQCQRIVFGRLDSFSTNLGIDSKAQTVQFVKEFVIRHEMFGFHI